MAKTPIKKTTAKSDTTVVTPKYKVTPKEISKNVVEVNGKGIGRTTYTVKNPSNDSTRTKIKANDLHLNTLMRRNSERRNEGKTPLPNKRTYTNDGRLAYFQNDGLSFKEKPIKATRVPIKKK